MLQDILIAGHATYSAEGQWLTGCKPINFIFGTNGAGKTTISRVIADPIAYPSCRLTWANGREVERLVYNTDFVDRNFSSTMKGIFTLGEESAETVTKIKAAKEKQDELFEDVRKLTATLKGADGKGGKVDELETLRTSFEEACWTIKNRHDEHFREVFEDARVRGAKARFCEKVLAEQSSNQAASRELEDLKARAKSVFQKGLVRQSLLTIPAFEDLLNVEQSPILGKRVVGKEDVNVSALITRLGNSDWVKQGRPFLDRSDDVCPFCQQTLLTDLARDLNDYFDETFADEMAAIDRAHSAYETYSSAILKRLDEVVGSGSPHLAVDELRADIDRLAQRIELNMRHLEAKKKEPSAVTTLEPLGEISRAITDRLSAVNTKVNEHNRLVDNITTETS